MSDRSAAMLALAAEVADYRPCLDPSQAIVNRPALDELIKHFRAAFAPGDGELGLPEAICRRCGNPASSSIHAAGCLK